MSRRLGIDFGQDGASTASVASTASPLESVAESVADSLAASLAVSFTSPPEASAASLMAPSTLGSAGESVELPQATTESVTRSVTEKTRKEVFGMKAT